MVSGRGGGWTSTSAGEKWASALTWRSFVNGGLSCRKWPTRGSVRRPRSEIKKKKLRGRRIKRPSRRRPTHTHTRARARTHEKRLSTLRAALMASPSSTIETFLFHFYILSRVGLFHRETREIEVIEVNNKKNPRRAQQFSFE